MVIIDMADGLGIEGSFSAGRWWFWARWRGQPVLGFDVQHAWGSWAKN